MALAEQIPYFASNPRKKERDIDLAQLRNGAIAVARCLFRSKAEFGFRAYCESRWQEPVTTAVGVLLGAMMGAALLPKLRSSTVRVVFVFVILWISAQMLYKGIRG